jgi:copper(I)-binding protein
VAALAVLAAGCGAGQQAQTANQVTATGGVGGEVGSVLLRDAQFTYDRPVPGGAVYAPGDDAALQVTIVNETSPGLGDGDRLVGVSSPIAASGRVVGDARVPDGQVLSAGYDEPVASLSPLGGDAVSIVLVDLLVPVRAGLTYPVVFTFEDAGDILLDVPVENPDVLPPRARDLDLPEEDRTLETGPEVGPEAADVGESPS